MTNASRLSLLLALAALFVALAPAEEITVLHYDRTVCSTFPPGCVQGVVVYIRAPKADVSAFRVELTYTNSSGEERQIVKFADRETNLFDVTVVTLTLDDISRIRVRVTPLVPGKSGEAAPERSRS